MKKLFAVVLLSLATVGAFAQAKDGSSKNEFRAFVGDATAFDVTHGLVNALTNALPTGSERITSGAKAFYGIGYRYRVNRFKFGADLGYLGVKTDVKLVKGAAVDYSTKDNYIFVLPSAEINYLKTGILELYGSGSVGAVVRRTTGTAATEAGKTRLAGETKDKSVDFAYQANPIGLRIGSESIGGFIEAGIGLKGFVNVGLSIRF